MKSKLKNLTQLQPAPYNPRAITDEAAAGLKQSLERFGDLSGIVWNSKTGHIVAGHQRFDKLLELGAELEGAELVVEGRRFPIREVDWDDATEKAANVAANSLAISGHFTTELGPLLQELQDRFEGFAPLRFDALEVPQADLDTDGGFMPAADGLDDAVDEIPDPPAKAITKLGDIWELGDHLLGCGDSRRKDDVRRLLQPESLDLIFTSPPYNVGVEYAGHDDKHTTWLKYGTFLREVAQLWHTALADGRVLAWNIGVSPKTFPALQQQMLEDIGLEHMRTLIWQKVGVPVPLFHNTKEAPNARNFHPNYTFEVVHLYSKGKLKKGGPVEFDETLQHDVFQIQQTAATRDIPNVEGGTRTGAQSNLDRRATKAHPAAFPVRLPFSFIRHLADVGAPVGDPFGGAGTTIIACEKSERVARCMELDPGYCDVAVERWQNLTGGKATRRKC